MKNILKRSTIWVVPLAATLLVSSCDSFLNKLPENSVEKESVDYSNTANMYMPVSGIYGIVRKKLANWSTYGCLLVRGDDVDKGGAPTDQMELEYASKFQNDKLHSFWALNSAWGKLL